MRKIIQLAVMQAQRPLVMKAFKMLELTYATFLLVSIQLQMQNIISKTLSPHYNPLSHLRSVGVYSI